MSDLLARLVSLADCDGRAGEPLGKAMREAAEEIAKLQIENKGLHDWLDAANDEAASFKAALQQLRIDAADAGMADTVQFIGNVLGDSVRPADEFDPVTPPAG
jgi:hypothetical protein